MEQASIGPSKKGCATNTGVCAEKEEAVTGGEWENCNRVCICKDLFIYMTQVRLGVGRWEIKTCVEKNLVLPSWQSGRKDETLSWRVSARSKGSLKQTLGQLDRDWALAGLKTKAGRPTCLGRWGRRHLCTGNIEMWEVKKIARFWFSYLLVNGSSCWRMGLKETDSRWWWLLTEHPPSRYYLGDTGRCNLEIQTRAHSQCSKAGVPWQ